MATKYGGLKFPFEQDIFQNALTRTSNINETIASAIRCFLVTSPGQRRGNITGSIMPSLKHRLVSSIEKRAVTEDIKKELIANFPGIGFQDVDVEQVVDVNKTILLTVSITFSTPVTELSQLSFIV